MSRWRRTSCSQYSGDTPDAMMEQFMKKSACLLPILIACFVLNAQNKAGAQHASTITLHGGLSLGLTAYAAENAPARQSPYSWVFSASPTLSVYGIQLPFNIIYANNSRQVTSPFQRFGVSPAYKWIRAHLGHRNLYFHPFILAGQPIFGAGVELNPKGFRFGAIYGRLAKAEFIDSTRANFRGQPSVFERKGYSIKLGFGSARNHFDFVWLKAADDPNSLQLQDTVSAPAENAALGISAQFSLGKWAVWNLDLAGSAYTRDTRADEVDIIDSIPFLKKAGVLFQPHLSSQVFGAGETSLRLLLGKSSLQVAFRQVQPDYKSMGTFFFQTDIEQLTISPNLVLCGSKLLLAGAVGLQRDNILQKKLFTSRRLIGNANLTWRPSNAFFAGIQYSNFGLTQSRFTDLVEDSLQLRLVNQNAGMNLQWSIEGEGKQHIVTFSANYQRTDDASPATSHIGDLGSIFSSAIYSLVLPQQQFNIFGGINFTRNDFASGDAVAFYGITAGAGKLFFDNKLNLRASGSYYIQKNEAADDGYTFSARIGGTWRLSKRQSLQLTSNLVQAANGRREWFGSISYGMSF